MRNQMLTNVHRAVGSWPSSSCAPGDPHLPMSERFGVRVWPDLIAGGSVLVAVAEVAVNIALRFWRVTTGLVPGPSLCGVEDVE